MRYQSEVKEIYDKFYNLSLQLVTPFESFPKLNLLGTYESEENFYHPKLIFNTISTNISIDSIVEVRTIYLIFNRLIVNSAKNLKTMLSTIFEKNYFINHD